MKKYKFTGETKIVHTADGDIKLNRIQAIIGFATVKAGDIGGWIETEENLAHDDNAWVFGNAQVFGDARVSGRHHVLVVGPIGSRNGFTTFYRGNNRQIMVICGCFNGIIDEFVKKVVKTHGENKHVQVYLAAAELAKLQIQEQHTGNSNSNTRILTK